MMDSVAGHFDNGLQLKEVTARELNAVSGGDNNMLMNWSTNTGVVFEVGGRIAIWVDGKKSYVPRTT